MGTHNTISLKLLLSLQPYQYLGLVIKSLSAENKLPLYSNIHQLKGQSLSLPFKVEPQNTKTENSRNPSPEFQVKYSVHTVFVTIY